MARVQTLLLPGLLLAAACGANAPAAAAPEGNPAKIEWISHLDPAKGELPEGLTLSADGNTAFVGLAPTGKILAIDTRSGQARIHGSVPAPPANEGYLFGLVLNPTGELFAGVASSSPSYRAGIYRLAPNGGDGTLYASHPELHFPNGLFEADGTLFVTDSLSGTIFRVSRGGETSKWFSDPLLAGDTEAPCANGAPFPIGANGIVLAGGAIYVVNTDHGSLLRIPVHPDGSAGHVSTVVPSDCAKLGGADGLAVDAEGTLFVAANAINAITRVTAQGDARVIVAGGGFDFPASVALRAGKPERQLFVTNAALKSAQTPGATPRPGLLALPLVN